MEAFLTFNSDTITVPASSSTPSSLKPSSALLDVKAEVFIGN